MESRNHEPFLGQSQTKVQAQTHQAEWDLRTALGLELRKILIEKRLKQRELASLLAIKQPQVSHLLNNHFSHFTIDKLVQLLNRLDWVVTFQVYPRKIN